METGRDIWVGSGTLLAKWCLCGILPVLYMVGSPGMSDVPDNDLWADITPARDGWRWQINIRLTEFQRIRLQLLAESRGLSVSELVRITFGLDRK